MFPSSTSQLSVAFLALTLTVALAGQEQQAGRGDAGRGGRGGRGNVQLPDGDGRDMVNATWAGVTAST